LESREEREEGEVMVKKKIFFFVSDLQKRKKGKREKLERI
jgi:hypothetical protein